MEPKGYLARAEQQISLCVMDVCTPLRKLAEQLASGTAGSSGERMQELLNQVDPLFPSRFCIEVGMMPHCISKSSRSGQHFQGLARPIYRS